MKGTKMTTQAKRRSTARNDADRTGRKAVAIDIENIVGGSDAGVDTFAAAWRVITRHALNIRPGDLVVVASGTHAAPRVMSALAGESVQLRWRSGIDGADLALIDFFDLPHEAGRWSQFVIASGDHLFAPLARQARELGMSTHQIIGRGRCSRELWQACDLHTRLRLTSANTLGLAA